MLLDEEDERRKRATAVVEWRSAPRRGRGGLYNGSPCPFTSRVLGNHVAPRALASAFTAPRARILPQLLRVAPVSPHSPLNGPFNGPLRFLRQEATNGQLAFSCCSVISRVDYSLTN